VFAAASAAMRDQKPTGFLARQVSAADGDEMRPIVVDGSASKLFRVLVVGGLSMASTAACSSSTSGSGLPGDVDASTSEDAKGEAAKDVATQEEASDSAPIPDVAVDSCIPYDALVDGPDGGFCAHGVCAW
jgi:hypothetical protein